MKRQYRNERCMRACSVCSMCLYFEFWHLFWLIIVQQITSDCPQSSILLLYLTTLCLKHYTLKNLRYPDKLSPDYIGCYALDIFACKFVHVDCIHPFKDKIIDHYKTVDLDLDLDLHIDLHIDLDLDLRWRFRTQNPTFSILSKRLLWVLVLLFLWVGNREFTSSIKIIVQR